MSGMNWKAITRQQWTVFAAVTLGYGLYYVCRLSLSVVKSPLIAEGALTETQVGLVGSALFYVYAVGKFANGFLADRVSLRRLFSLGLLVSALVNLVLGCGPGFVVFLIAWAINGWSQAMGAPASVVSLTRWFDRKQRGTFYGFWSSSHNIGEGLTFVLTSAVVATAGWRAGFEVAALAGLAGAVVFWTVYRDKRPAETAEASANKVRDVGAAQRRVLANPVVWMIALASAAMYVTRYALNSWGIFYFEHARGCSTVEAGGLIAVSSVCGVIGTVLSGWISDVAFKGDRFLPATLFGFMNLGSLALVFWAPVSWSWAPVVAMVGFGCAIGALVCYLGGLMAVDVVSPKAAGAALGVVGIASYLGAGTQDILSGWLIGRGKHTAGYDFSAAEISWVTAASLVIVFTELARRLHRERGNVDADDRAT